MDKQKSSFTTEKPIDYAGAYDYTNSKDAYDGNITSEKNNTEKEGTGMNVEPLPESSRPRKDGPGGN